MASQPAWREVFFNLLNSLQLYCYKSFYKGNWELWNDCFPEVRQRAASWSLPGSMPLPIFSCLGSGQSQGRDCARCGCNHVGTVVGQHRVVWEAVFVPEHSTGFHWWRIEGLHLPKFNFCRWPALLPYSLLSTQQFQKLTSRTKLIAPALWSPHPKVSNRDAYWVDGCVHGWMAATVI